MRWHLIGLSTVLLVALALAPAAQAHYVPAPPIGFSYDETVSVGNGIGNYGGYTESTVINGSLAVTAVLSNGTDQSRYYNEDVYHNSSGASYGWSSSGRFVFSPQTFLYVNGTDNQTGYTSPSVWFFIDNSVGPGSQVTLLNSEMSVVTTSYSYDLGTSAGNVVRTIFVEGNGSYERDDSYGVFTATYNWKAYFDPGTGFIVGYLYTELDRDSSGNGFTLTDALTVTSTTYPLTAGSSSSGSSSSGSSSIDWPLLIGALVAVVVIVVIVVVILAVARARRRHPLARHSATGQVSYVPPPVGPAPPPIQLLPSGQPAVQQIIVKETVKVKCPYCGSLIDSTAEKCPFCGASRN